MKHMFITPATPWTLSGEKQTEALGKLAFNRRAPLGRHRHNYTYRWRDHLLDSRTQVSYLIVPAERVASSTVCPRSLYAASPPLCPASPCKSRTLPFDTIMPYRSSILHIVEWTATCHSLQTIISVSPMIKRTAINEGFRNVCNRFPWPKATSFTENYATDKREENVK